MQGKGFPFFSSLSSQLLVLTVLFVMAVEVVVYVPSLAQFRKNFLDQRLVAAQIAILSLEESDEEGLSPMLERELLEVAEIQAVVVISAESREMVLRSTLPDNLSGSYDLRDPGLFELARDALMTLLRKGEGSIQIQGEPVNPRYQSIQVVLREEPLYFSMVEFSESLLWNSLIISFFTGGLIFFSLMFFLVRPTKRITENLTRFSEQPDRKDNTLKASGRRNEIGLLEDQIAHMQQEIQKALGQKRHLTNLGMAVSKINHDLKNILSTARLSLDRLTSGKAKENQEQIVGRLVRAVDRAVGLTERTLKYGKSDESPPSKTSFPLQSLVLEVRDALKELSGNAVTWTIQIPRSLKVAADRDQLFRVLFNLCRNGLEAMDGRGELTVSAKAGKKEHIIRVADTGSGIPEHLQKGLFVPFAVTTKGSGSGLGLAIAEELVRAHNGKILLEASGPGGTTFSVTLPAEKI